MGHPRETETPERDGRGAPVPTRDAERGGGSLSGELLQPQEAGGGGVLADAVCSFPPVGVWCGYRYEYEAAVSGAEQNPRSPADAGPGASARVGLSFILFDHLFCLTSSPDVSIWPIPQTGSVSASLRPHASTSLTVCASLGGP